MNKLQGRYIKHIKKMYKFYVKHHTFIAVHKENLQWISTKDDYEREVRDEMG